MRRRLLATTSAIALLAVLLPGAVASAASETYVVTKTADTADGTCDADCSLREAITAANANPGADTVVLPAGTYTLTLASTDEDANADGDLDVTDDVTIIGAGSGTTTIDAGGDLDGDDDGDHRVLEMVEDSSLGLDHALGIAGVTITGGDIAASTTDGSGGGAILMADSGVLALDDVVVADNRSIAGAGGVEANGDGNSIRIENSRFEGNVAASGDGGALTLEEGSLTLRDVVFTGNMASSNGGALYLENETNTQAWDVMFVDNEATSGNGGGMVVGTSSYGSLLVCTGCDFTGNTAGGDGGGLYIGDEENHVELTDVRFDGNRTASEGGGLYMDESQLLLTDFVFVDNVTEDEGGGLWMEESGATIENGRFEGNQAYHQGGGLAGEDMYVTVRDVDVINNVAFDPDSPTEQTEGGGISNEEDYGAMLLERVRVEGNTATHAGAGLYLYETSVHIVDSVFIDNAVTASSPTADVEGGAISETNESRILIERTHFENNSVSGDQNAHGGAIWRQEGPTTILDSSFVGNTATTTYTTDDTYYAAGGAFFTDYSTPGLLEVQRTLFADNAATGDAGAIGRGGAIFLEDDSTAVVTNSTFSGNDALTEGGVFYGVDSGRLRLQSSTLVGNTAGSGAAVFLAADTGSGPGQADVKGSLLQDHGDDSCAGDPVTSNGWNIVDDATCGLDEPSDQDDTAVGYEPLADNGGFSATHALTDDSIAIDAGATDCTDVAGVFALTTDQRGANRPVDGDGDATAACDVGAYEHQEAVTVVATDDAATEGADGVDGTATFTFSRPGTDGDLEVAYTVGGTAGGDDYSPELSGTVMIPDGSASATVTITAEADEADEGAETVVVTLEAQPTAYRIGTPSSATATITDPEPEPDVGGTFRLAGESRVLTAIAISQDSYGDGEAGAVVLARSDLFPDALAGTPLAVAVDAPILLTPPDALDADVLEEIERVLPAGGTVHLLGGPVALSTAVEDAVDDAGFESNRIGGEDRIDTSILIAGELGDPDTLLVTTGFNFPDALAAGPAAVEAGGAVILSTPEVPSPTTTAYLDSQSGATVYAIGGPAARAYPSADDVAGENRAETATLVAREFFDDPALVGLAISTNFPDALAGGVHIGRLGGPLVITDGTSLDDAPEDYLCESAASIGTLYGYGGTVVLAQSVLDAAGARIDGTGC